MSDAKATAEDLAERRRRMDRLKQGSKAKGFMDYVQLLFSAPATPTERTEQQLKTARTIAAKELKCSPDEVSADKVAAIAQVLATNHAADAMRWHRK